MATATDTLAVSQIEDASLLLQYDTSTLKGTAVEASVGAAASGPMTVNIVLGDGTVLNYVVQPNQFNKLFNIPAKDQPQGTLVTTRFGTQTIAWPFQSVSISFNG